MQGRLSRGVLRSTLIAFLATSCGQTNDRSQTLSLDSLRVGVAALVARENLNARVLNGLREDVHKFETITIDPASRGYQRLDTSTGMFLVSCEDVQPFLDGHKVALTIGNISSASYDGFSLTLNWGPGFEEGLEFDKWSALQKTKETSFTETLIPGKWNRVTVVVSPSTPAELKNLTLAMTTNTVSLGR